MSLCTTTCIASIPEMPTQHVALAHMGSVAKGTLLMVELEGTGHYWQLLKIIVGIKTYLEKKSMRAVDSIKH